MGMFDNLKQLGDLKKMRDQAMEVQKRLQLIKITVEHKGVIVVMTGDQKVVSLSESNPSTRSTDAQGRTEQSRSATGSGQVDLDKVTEAVNEALKQSQKVAAEEMKGLMGGMPGR